MRRPAREGEGVGRISKAIGSVRPVGQCHVRTREIEIACANFAGRGGFGR